MFSSANGIDVVEHAWARLYKCLGQYFLTWMWWHLHFFNLPSWSQMWPSLLQTQIMILMNQMMKGKIWCRVLWLSLFTSLILLLWRSSKGYCFRYQLIFQFLVVPYFLHISLTCWCSKLYRSNTNYWSLSRDKPEAKWDRYPCLEPWMVPNFPCVFFTKSNNMGVRKRKDI